MVKETKPTQMKSKIEFLEIVVVIETFGPQPRLSSAPEIVTYLNKTLTQKYFYWVPVLLNICFVQFEQHIYILHSQTQALLLCSVWYVHTIL